MSDPVPTFTTAQVIPRGRPAEEATVPAQRARRGAGRRESDPAATTGVQTAIQALSLLTDDANRSRILLRAFAVMLPRGLPEPATSEARGAAS